jgi:hypothetical protein
MPNDSTRTVLVALGAGLGVALAKVGAAVFTGSAALAPRPRTHSPIAGTTFLCTWPSVAAAAIPTISIPWGTGGRPTSGR